MDLQLRGKTSDTFFFFQSTWFRSVLLFSQAGIRASPGLKSGVIDGMPYTLYADGSIEAAVAAGHGEVRLRRCVARASRKAELTRPARSTIATPALRGRRFRFGA